jgi:methylated-DNA-protein-cysteine methyltransferase-like protein
VSRRERAVPAPDNRNQRVWRTVLQIPRGKVATYGQIASLADVPGPSGPRQVGYALAALADDSTVPWQRVVNAAGEISARDSLGGASQRALLEAEGVAFDAHGKIDFQRYRWTP